MFTTEVKISIFLKFAEDLSVGFSVKVISTIENLKIKPSYSQSIGSLELITLIGNPNVPHVA